MWVLLAMTVLALGCSRDSEPPVDTSEDVDADGDGWTVGDGDCDDGDASIHPDAEDACVGGGPADLNCDGYASIDGVHEFYVTEDYRDDDGDGWGGEAILWDVCRPLDDTVVENDFDCDDGNSAIGPHAEEVDNGVDDDCDGDVDEGF
jgi:hypothetical protein